jgi:hypothetical protein
MVSSAELAWKREAAGGRAYTLGARSNSIEGLAIKVQMYISMSAHAPLSEGPYVRYIQNEDGANG